MPKRKKQPKMPRKVGDILVTEAVVERRKWAKRPTGNDQPNLFTAGTSSDQSSASKGVSPPAAPDRSEARTAAAGGDSLFQYYGHCCDKKETDAFAVKSDKVLRPEDLGEFVGREYRIRPCRCHKWFCEWCGPRKGIQLRQRLLARLASFTGVYGITLTVDGSLFASPEETWLYVMDKRLLSRFVRELDRSKHLHSRAFFWVVEFQSQTEQPHWHLLVDAIYVPYGEIVAIWSSYRPESAGPLQERVTAENYRGQAPAFGSVRYTQRSDKVRAGYYATKYLTKHPKGGYPAWVLSRVGRMPRYGRSRRFFPRVSGHDPSCFCEECYGQAEPAAKQTIRKATADDERVRRVREPVSIGQRVQQCGNGCIIVQVTRVRLPDGSVIDGRGRFNGKLNISFREACEFFGLSPTDRWQIEVRGEQVTALEEFARRDDAEEAA